MNNQIDILDVQNETLQRASEELKHPVGASQWATLSDEEVAHFLGRYYGYNFDKSMLLVNEMTDLAYIISIS